MHVTIQSRVEGKANICWTPGNYFWWLSKSEARSGKKKKRFKLLKTGLVTRCFSEKLLKLSEKLLKVGKKRWRKSLKATGRCSKKINKNTSGEVKSWRHTYIGRKLLLLLNYYNNYKFQLLILLVLASLSCPSFCWLVLHLAAWLNKV